VSKRQLFKQLAGREYLPLAATAAMWGIVVLALGHADAARLLATVTFVRSIQLLTKLATPTALKRRAEAPKVIRRQARRYAFVLQLASLTVALSLVALLVEAMTAIGQDKIAAYLPFAALGMPARTLRLADIKSSSPYFRLALSSGGLVMAALAWATGWPLAMFGLIFGAREWIAYAVLRWWPRTPLPPKVKLSEPLRFAEVARYSVILGRRLLTYRISKSVLTIFGPFGNAAARTGRGLNWHKKIEPYVPHHLGGFIVFSLATMGGGAFLALRSGEPAAMILAAGLAQIGATTSNVVLLWRWLPSRDSEAIAEDDDDEE
jgi:hypothetical protein